MRVTGPSRTPWSVAAWRDSKKKQALNRIEALVSAVEVLYGDILEEDDLARVRIGNIVVELKALKQEVTAL